MKKILFLLVAIMLSSAGMAQSEDNWLKEANEAYNEGNYDQALELYGKVEEAGMESAALYYNMGDTYYKMKSYPMAILYYEKALKLDPGNEDIRVNLKIANMAIADKINVIPQSFIARWWNSLRQFLSADGWAWVSIIMFGVLLLCLFAFLMSKRTGLRKAGFFVGLLTVVCLVLSLAFAIGQYRDMRCQDEAIIITPTVSAKSSPSVNSVDLFVLHEGTKVRILDSSKDWNKIKIADGSLGWLQASDMISF